MMKACCIVRKKGAYIKFVYHVSFCVCEKGCSEVKRIKWLNIKYGQGTNIRMKTENYEILDNSEINI